MPSYIYRVPVDDPILNEPSLERHVGYSSYNFFFKDSVANGIKILTSNVELFKKAKFIFVPKTTVNGEHVDIVPIRCIEFYEPPNKGQTSFGAPSRVDYYISNESSKEMIEYKLKNG